MNDFLQRWLPIPASYWERFRRADPSLMAAAIAFLAFVSLVPASAAFLTAASFFGRDAEALADTRQTLNEFLPTEVADFVGDLLQSTAKAVSGQRGLVIVVSLVLALWFGSRGTYALMRALRRIEDLEEHRPIWTVRGVAIILTVSGGVTLALVIAALVAGDRAAAFFADLTGVAAVETVWSWLHIPVAVAGLYVSLALIYMWGPPRPFTGWWLAAAVSTVALAFTSAIFGWYVSNFGLGSSFGVLGTVAVVLIWLYMGALVLLFSAAAAGFGWKEFANKG